MRQEKQQRRYFSNLTFLCFTLTFILLAFNVNAEDRYWIATTDSNWNNTANWSTSSGGSGGASVPGIADEAFFDGNGLGNVTIDANVDLMGINISSAYTGNISQGVFTINATTSIAINGGTFSGGSATIDIGLDLTMTGGTFNSTSGILKVGRNFTRSSGAVFNHNMGTVIFDSQNGNFDVHNEDTFRKVIVNKDEGFFLLIDPSQKMIVLDSVVFRNGGVDSGTIQVLGEVIVEANWDGGAGTLSFAGTDPQMLDLTTTNGMSVNTIELDKSSGALDILSKLKVDNLNIVSGTFNGGNETIDIDVDLTLTGGTFNSTTGTLNIGRDFISNAAAVFNHNFGTAMFDAQNGSFNVDTEKTFNKVIVNKDHNNRLSIGSGDKMIVTDTLSLIDGQVNVGRVESHADIVVGADWDGGGGILSVVGPSVLNLDISASSGVLLNTLEINKPGSSVNLLSEMMIDNLTLLDGTFNGGSNTIDLDDNLTLESGVFNSTTGDLYIGNNFTSVNTAGFNHNSGVVIFDGSNGVYNVTSEEFFYQVVVDKNDGRRLSIGTGDELTVLNTLYLNDGLVNIGTLKAFGDILVEAGWDGGTGTLRCVGVVSQDLNLQLTNGILLNRVIIDKFANSVNLLSDLRVNHFTNERGTFNGGSGTMDVDIDFTLNGGIFNSTSGNLIVGREFYSNTVGVFNHNSGTVTFDSDDSIFNATPSETFYDVVLEKNNGQALTVASGDKMTVLNSLVLNTGIIWIFTNGSIDVLNNTP